ncbi:MAG: thiol-disulfide oxidoreductase DCC family protein [Dongiaceae bacterium]
MTIETMTGDIRRSPSAVLTVFYNGDCAVCRARMVRYQQASAAGSRLIAWCDAARVPWALRRFHVDPATARRRIHVVDGEGRLFGGAAAFARLWRELPGYRLLGYLAGLPLVAPLAEVIYRLAAARLFANLNSPLARERGRGSG